MARPIRRKMKTMYITSLLSSMAERVALVTLAKHPLEASRVGFSVVDRQGNTMNIHFENAPASLARVAILMMATLLAPAHAVIAQDAYANDSIEVAKEIEEGGLERIAFAVLPESVRRKARKEFPNQQLIAVEKSKEDGQVMYHVMFEVNGTEAGLRMDRKGTILDRWHFDGEDDNGFRKDATSPTLEDIPYGPHKRNVLDLWMAKSQAPAPLLVCIHGGGFSGGDKRGFREDSEMIATMLGSGVSVAAINYRLTEDGKNPYPIPMHDGARAVQFLRHHAKKYNLNKKRFAATGGSAGGCMPMWLGFHPDLAKPNHKDLVLRESSRLQVLAPHGGQSCLHLPTWRNGSVSNRCKHTPPTGHFLHSKQDRSRSPIVLTLPCATPHQSRTSPQTIRRST